jgi:allantoicase
MKKPSAVHYVAVSTKYHLGNQAQFTKLEGLNTETNTWQEIIPKTVLEGHAMKRMKTSTGSAKFSQIKMSLYPDGGISRLGLYDESLPESEKSKYVSPEQAKSEVFTDEIPKTQRSLAPKYDANAKELAANWQAAGDEVDVASLAYGAKTVKATNEHYGPAAQVISPYPPLHMFDGMESARSRDKGHFEEVVIELAKPALIHRLELDFTYFVNNNPLEVSVEGLTNGAWTSLVPRTNVKAYAANKFTIDLSPMTKVTQIKLTAFPDGGINRVKAFARRSQL